MLVISFIRSYTSKSTACWKLVWLIFWIVSSFFLRRCLSRSSKLKGWTLVLRFCSTVLAVGIPKWWTSFSETHFMPSFTYNIQNTSASVLLCIDMYMCLSIWENNRGCTHSVPCVTDIQVMKFCLYTNYKT